MRVFNEINSSNWFGVLPEGWKMVPLKQLFNFSRGISVTKADLVKEGAPIVNYGQIHDKRNNGVEISNELIKFIPYEKLGINAKKTQTGSFLFACTSEDLQGCGSCIHFNNDIWAYAGGDTILLTPKKRVNSKFLAYLFLTDLWRYQIRRDLVDVKVFHVNAFNLKETYVVLPPLKLKDKIASYLDFKCKHIDEAIKRHRLLIEKLNNYKSSLINHAVIKGLDLNTNMKESGINWIGKIPESWDIVPLSRLFKEHKHENTLNKEKNLLSLSYGKIKKKDINANEGLLPASFAGYNIISVGDIVLRLTDLQNDKRSLRTAYSLEKGIITSAYITIRNINNLCTKYFYYLLHSYDIKKVFYNMGNGVRQSLNYKELSKLQLLLPSLNEQIQISSYLDDKTNQIDATIMTLKEQIEKLIKYKKSLICSAVTGKLDCQGENNATC